MNNLFLNYLVLENLLIIFDYKSLDTVILFNIRL